jgi:hypothetical protein
MGWTGEIFRPCLNAYVFISINMYWSGLECNWTKFHFISLQHTWIEADTHASSLWERQGEEIWVNPSLLLAVSDRHKHELHSSCAGSAPRLSVRIELVWIAPAHARGTSTNRSPLCSLARSQPCLIGTCYSAYLTCYGLSLLLDAKYST